MTRRERLEAKIDKREEWADGRDKKAEALHKTNEPYRGDHAFNTQPGHIPERARAIKRTEKACEHQDMANHHRSKAAGLAGQLDRTIFSDDTDAIEKLHEKIANLEASRDNMKVANKIVRAKNLSEAEKLEQLAKLLGSEKIAGKLLEPDYCRRLGFPSYALKNIGATIRQAKKRIGEIEYRQKQTQKAEAAGGVLVERVGEYCRVTFEEKPERETLNALRAAGFTWGGGCWAGHYSKLPEGIPSSFDHD